MAATCEQRGAKSRNDQAPSLHHPASADFWPRALQLPSGSTWLVALDDLCDQRVLHGDGLLMRLLRRIHIPRSVGTKSCLLNQLHGRILLPQSAAMVDR